MRSLRSHLLSPFTVVVVCAVGLGVVAGCDSGGGRDAAADARASARRARAVAAAWDGSTTARAWRVGYHPMGEVTLPPRGGLHNRADEQAFREGNFVLRGTLATANSVGGRVTWTGGRSLARPLVGAAASYESLAGGRSDAGPHLTVVGVRPGRTTVRTSRGPATVPAWLFTLDGYAAPLRQAAAVPAPLPRSPIGPAPDDVPGRALGQLAGVAADGRSVTVIAVQGACKDTPSVAVLETRGSLVLSARAGHRGNDGGVCTKQARATPVTVRTAHPVADRVVLDAHTGRPLPHTSPHGLVLSWK
ncbi:hypothetical protein ACIQU5_11910 [Streptomyces sp. NPDC090306]|uniref:hypothetical protein n=1 Tax=Streptomyces sp. NPDC090306 TaxID=3365961 RepID=UPI0037FD7631